VSYCCTAESGVQRRSLFLTVEGLRQGRDALGRPSAVQTCPHAVKVTRSARTDGLKELVLVLKDGEHDDIYQMRQASAKIILWSSSGMDLSVQ